MGICVVLLLGLSTDSQGDVYQDLDVVPAGVEIVAVTREAHRESWRVRIGANADLRGAHEITSDDLDSIEAVEVSSPVVHGELLSIQGICRPRDGGRVDWLQPFVVSLVDDEGICASAFGFLSVDGRYRCEVPVWRIRRRQCAPQVARVVWVPLVPGEAFKKASEAEYIVRWNKASGQHALDMGHVVIPSPVLLSRGEQAINGAFGLTAGQFDPVAFGRTLEYLLGCGEQEAIQHILEYASGCWGWLGGLEGRIEPSNPDHRDPVRALAVASALFGQEVLGGAKSDLIEWEGTFLLLGSGPNARGIQLGRFREALAARREFSRGTITAGPSFVEFLRRDGVDASAVAEKICGARNLQIEAQVKRLMAWANAVGG